MRIIFLAAGKGKRIFKYFKINKPLIKIGNLSLLENLILGARDYTKKKISVIVGYKKKNILIALKDYTNIEFIDNKKFGTTDMVHSLIMGLEKYKIRMFDKLDLEAKPRLALDANAKFLKGSGLIY